MHTSIAHSREIDGDNPEGWYVVETESPDGDGEAEILSGPYNTMEGAELALGRRARLASYAGTRPV